MAGLGHLTCKPWHFLSLCSILAAVHLATGAGLGFDVATNYQEQYLTDAKPPLDASGYGTIGANYVIAGYIYPLNTLAGNTTGIAPDGTPTLPSKLIGMWFSAGVYLASSANATGVVANSTQTYVFTPSSVLQGAAIQTTGTELADMNVPFDRKPVLPLPASVGTIAKLMQTNLGSNPSGGTTIRYTSV